MSAAVRHHSGYTAVLALALLLVSGPVAAGETTGDPAADPGAVDPFETVTAPWLVQSGAADLASAMAVRSALRVPGNGPDFVLDGIEGRRWLVSVDGLPLLAAPWGGLATAAQPLALFLDERIAARAGPGPGTHGDGALGGVVEIERTHRRSAAAVQVASELRVGSTVGSRVALAAGSDRGVLTADVAAFADAATGPLAAIDALRASGARGRLALGLGSNAQLGLECLGSTLASGAARQQRSVLRFDSALQLYPGQQLRFDLVRQGLVDRPGAADPGLALDETALRARYVGELVVGHGVDFAILGRVESARRAASAERSAAPYRAVLGIAGSDDWRIRPKLRLRASGSLSLDDRVGGLVAGRVALRYEPARALVVRGVVGAGQRAPTLEENAFESGHLTGPETGDVPALRAERSQGYRLSAGFEPRPDGFARVTVFRTDLADLIEPSAGRADTLSGPQQYHNIGQVHVQGLAIDVVALRLGGGIGLDLAYRWLYDARDDRSGQLLADRPEHLANLLVSWDVAAWGTQLFVHTRLMREHVSAATGELAPLASVDAGVQVALFEAIDVVFAVDNAAGGAGRPTLPVPERAARVVLRLRNGAW